MAILTKPRGAVAFSLIPLLCSLWSCVFSVLFSHQHEPTTLPSLGPSAFVFAEAASVTEMLSKRADLSESFKFARESGVLEDIQTEAYGSFLTVLFPTNDAWQRVSLERKEYLMMPENRADLETLLLFSATDSVIRREDVYPGMEPLITLLGVEAQVNGDSICVLSMHDRRPYDCARVVVWNIPIAEGVVHILDKVLFPEELLQVFEGSEMVWRRRLADSDSFSQDVTQTDEESPEAVRRLRETESQSLPRDLFESGCDQRVDDEEGIGERQLLR